MLANKYKAASHHPVFAAALALSGEIGKSSACRQAQTLQNTTTPTAAKPTPNDCVMKAAIAMQPNNTNVVVEMPLDVLARTCESFPQLAHEAGDERLDQRSARLDMASALHQGHLCMRLTFAMSGELKGFSLLCIPRRKDRAAHSPFRPSLTDSEGGFDD
jgi:hypothetical protein